MSLRCVARVATVTVLVVFELACGQTYRPVVIPLTTTPPNPANFHTVFALSANTLGNPGTGMQIDVSGDTDVGEATSIGFTPMHAAMAPNQARLFVASAGSLAPPNGKDSVAFLAPASVFGGNLTQATAVSLPTGSLPDFVATTQNGFVYVANFGTNSVNAINTFTNQAGNPAPVGVNPVAMAETPDTRKLYVANQGDGTVTSLNTVDMTANPAIPVGSQPVWVVARVDSQRVYVLTQGGGQLVTIDTATDAVTSSLPVGAGANFMFYDSHLNRLYVTNPVAETVYVFSATGGANDTPNPTPLAVFSLAAGPSSPCPAGCAPASVTALADGSRFYVASYQDAPVNCPDPTVAAPCMVPQLTVYDAQSLTVKVPTVSLLSGALFAKSQTAVPRVTSCVTPPTYVPGTTRFRVFAAAAADSSRVYVSMCDAGAIADINTTDSNTNNPGNPNAPDTLVLDLPTPVAVCPGTCTGNLPLQNPLLLVVGQ